MIGEQEGRGDTSPATGKTYEHDSRRAVMLRIAKTAAYAAPATLAMLSTAKAAPPPVSS